MLLRVLLLTYLKTESLKICFVCKSAAAPQSGASSWAVFSHLVDKFFLALHVFYLLV